ncbi:fam-a protein [Plasmodium vinckei brucechwatti]|uniref:Fam-a protein n=1 Tax=Plasmodium vinckei brucechwatti TaxID=119398 RepID=A0A6V7T4A8_PLAVN|nr:fam-a protein [Plasmodium vinckei brucechwatti]
MNKFYIQIALFLLSIFAYANNEAFAAETAPGQATKPKSRFATPEEVYEQNKHLLCTNLNEIKNAEKLMNEAVKQLEYHATSKDGYEVYAQNPTDSISYYIKKFDDQTNILKVHLNIYAANQYNDMINRLWDPNGPKIFNKGTSGILYMYNPNLVFKYQVFEKDSKCYNKFFFALVGKVEISKDKTIIAMTSVNKDDRNHSNKKYKNPILKSAESFYSPLEHDSNAVDENYREIYVNLAGYLIEKKGDDLEITYIESIEGHSSI